MFFRTIFFVLFSTMATAQSVDLTGLPDGFSFTSRGEDGNTTVTFVSRDDNLFKFNFSRDDTRGDPQFDTVWVNRDSQTVKFFRDGLVEKYEPHDCAPQIGTCNFVANTLLGEQFELSRSSYMIGDVWIDRLFIMVEGEKLIISQTCSTFDQFGFWIDYVSEDYDGEKSFGERISSSIDVGKKTSFKEIQKLCRDTKELSS